MNAMKKIIMPVSNPSREGTMECVACELPHKIKRDFRVFDKTVHTYFKSHIIYKHVQITLQCQYDSTLCT